jgi:hypothetical protein
MMIALFLMNKAVKKIAFDYVRRHDATNNTQQSITHLTTYRK